MRLDREGHLDFVLMETHTCLDLGDRQDLGMSTETRILLDLEGHLDWDTLVKKHTCWDFTDFSHFGSFNEQNVNQSCNHSVTR